MHKAAKAKARARGKGTKDHSPVIRDVIADEPTRKRQRQEPVSQKPSKTKASVPRLGNAPKSLGQSPKRRGKIHSLGGEEGGRS